VDPPDEPASTGRGVDPSWLEWSYDVYPRIEEEFRAALETSLDPRGPDVLYELVEEMGLPARSVAVDVGCAEGKHAFNLAERFDFIVTGIDPVARHIELARAEAGERASADPEITGLIRFVLGTAEALPLDDETVDLIWCRDVLVHVADLERAYAEFQRVLRPNAPNGGSGQRRNPGTVASAYFELHGCYGTVIGTSRNSEKLPTRSCSETVFGTSSG